MSKRTIPVQAADEAEPRTPAIPVIRLQEEARGLPFEANDRGFELLAEYWGVLHTRH